jgi:hypothetical protein
VTPTLVRGRQWPADVERILGARSDWFGLPEANARTRAFYVALGFVPLEERTDIWGPGTPCLIFVKPLAG